MARLYRKVHGVPVWLMGEYLLELGGTEREPGVIAGEGWVAAFCRIEDFCIGSLRIGVVELEISGEADALSELEPQLDLKLLRGGG